MSALDKAISEYRNAHGTFANEASAELAELKAELQAANEDADRLYRALKSTDMEFMELEGPAIAAHEVRMQKGNHEQII